MIVAGADNRPPMLEKSMYTSWASRMLLYIKGKEHGRMMLNSILNGPLVYPTIEVDGVTRLKTYEEPRTKKDFKMIDQVKLLMQGTELSYQERECKLYNEFDKFASIKGETIHDYYIRFAQLMNDIHIIGMTMQQVQVNTRFLNGLQPELAVLSFLPGDDLIASLNKAMAFLSTTIASRFPTTNKSTQIIFQPKKSSYRLGWQSYSSTSSRKTKSGLCWKGLPVGQDTQTTMLINAAFQNDDLDAFDPDCDEAPGAQAILMANLSSYDSDVISKVPNYDNYQNNVVSDMCV
ncbi:hypothetical protein Tco_0475966 [Tanacetum coccineum]